jgi:hypothetical protein
VAAPKLRPVRLFLTAAALRASVSAETAPPSWCSFILDQGRAEYLERFRPALGGGLLFLLERGVIFTATHHAHAVTVTAPGHASLSTGRFPSRSGIVGNEWYDRDEKRDVYCVEDRESPLSRLGPRNGRPEFLDARRGVCGLARRPDGSAFARRRSTAAGDRAAVPAARATAPSVRRRDWQWVTSRYYMESTVWPGSRTAAAGIFWRWVASGSRALLALSRSLRCWRQGFRIS